MFAVQPPSGASSQLGGSYAPNTNGYGPHSIPAYAHQAPPPAPPPAHTLSTAVDLMNTGKVSNCTAASTPSSQNKISQGFSTERHIPSVLACPHAHRCHCHIEPFVSLNAQPTLLSPCCTMTRASHAVAGCILDNLACAQINACQGELGNSIMSLFLIKCHLAPCLLYLLRNSKSAKQDPALSVCRSLRTLPCMTSTAGSSRLSQPSTRKQRKCVPC